MLRKALRTERGFALVPALLVMVILLTFATAAVTLAEGDQADSRREREAEASFQLTEGVLNAQIYQLSMRWPGATAAAVYPSACGPTTTNTDCPTTSALKEQFKTVDYAAGSQWETQVRDNGGATPNYWTDDLLNSPQSYDANDDNFLWVRASGVVHGRKRTLVALVEAENVTLNFPRATLVSGHFETSNNGNKVIIDTNGEANQFSPGDIIVRCPLGAAGCASYESDKGQIAPDTVRSNPSQPRAVSVEALDQLRDRAKAEGNYYTGCAPALEGDQPGELVFMENATGCNYNANNVYNTPSKPGYVVIARGAMGDINGTATFYGILYHANLDNAAGDLITLGGNVSVYGSIVIDGPGGLSAGSSKVNLVYDPNVFNGFKAFGTAGIVQNTFREITAGS
jgi:type II secretory pathway pseudopilin PulG